ncbi:MAG TPA: ANTAR domain-containing protein [Bryobacteraceae bacterium]|jgi:hypothetical protein|nr:ANTAR domain-containing protein [Bryobacteraceae bacterium]
MSVVQITNAEPELSHFEMRAGALGLETSRVLSRRRSGDPGNAMDAILNLISNSGLASAAAIWSEWKGEGAGDRAFGAVDDPSEYTVGAYEDNYVLLYLGLASKNLWATESLPLLAELLAQQLGRFLSAERLRQDNRTDEKQLRLDREALQLRKMLERARALLARHGSMTTIEATDYMVSASARTGRPLLQVAERIVLAYGGPETGFRWPATRGTHGSAPQFCVGRPSMRHAHDPAFGS